MSTMYINQLAMLVPRLVDMDINKFLEAQSPSKDTGQRSESLRAP